MTRIEIEHGIIGTVLIDPKHLPHIMARIRSEYFTDTLCRQVFEVASELYNSSVEPSLQNVRASGKMSEEQMVGLSPILARADFFDLNLLTHILCEQEAKMRLDLGLEAARQAVDTFRAVTLAQDACQAAQAVLLGAARMTKGERIDRVALRFSEETRGKVTRFPTGFPTLDRMLRGGLSEAGLSFVGGYAGEGKTSFALAIAVHLAQLGTKVEFLEGEMPEYELHDRAARMLHGQGNGGRLLWLKEYEALPLDLILLPDRTPHKLLASVEYAAVNGARFIVADYLQAFAQQQNETDRHYLSIKNLSADLRALVLRHAEKGEMIHVMALSNLNRSELARGPGGRRMPPGLGSLYGSAGLAHDCTEAIMVYSEDEERLREATTGQRSVTVEVVKARDAMRGPLPSTSTVACSGLRRPHLSDFSRGAVRAALRSVVTNGWSVHNASLGARNSRCPTLTIVQGSESSSWATGRCHPRWLKLRGPKGLVPVIDGGV
jgi:RecA/RadA recombinase